MKNKIGSKIMTLIFLISLAGFNTISAKAEVAAESTVGINLPGNANYFPLGVNYAWQDWDRDFSDEGWSTRFNTIKSTFDDMSSKGVRAVRWWVFCNSYASPNFSSTGVDGVCTGLPTNWVQHMKEAADYAYSKNMKIYFTLSSFDEARNNNAWNHSSIIDDPVVRKSFIDNAIKPIMQGLSDNPGVMGWDVINEPEWIISASDNGGHNDNTLKAFPLSTVRSYVKDIVDCIHQYAKQPVSVGSANMKWISTSGGQYDFWSGLGLDFYDIHWYDWATPWFNPLTTPVSALNLDKPVIIGEMMPDTLNSSLKMSHKDVLEGLLKNGYSGYLLWAWTDSAINCIGKTNPDFDAFKTAHPELNIDGQAITVIKGDLNNDGKVNISDYIVLKKELLVSTSTKDLAVWDMDNDGKINIFDYLALKKAILNV
jgi:hypothetical protein